MRISDWSSDVCSSDLPHRKPNQKTPKQPLLHALGRRGPLEPAPESHAHQCIGAIKQKTDADQHHPEGRKLPKHRPALWVDELRQEYRAKQQRLGIEQVGQQPAPNRLAPMPLSSLNAGIFKTWQQRGSQALKTYP